jgi:formylglycine-generating enzyme required for sulfatase activity
MPAATSIAFAAAEVVVGPGAIEPFYAADDARVEVPAFVLDVDPVTEGEFQAFVERNPAWRRDRVPRILADETYLSHWASPEAAGRAIDPRAPVTRVSWFAARAYCEARGRTLPTEAQWELAAAASPTRADAWDDAAMNRAILDWYATPNPARLPAAGQGVPNYWGVRDLHGLVWEWVLDFNASLVSTDPREAGDGDTAAFCGSGALGARDSTDYATFQRYAFRSSLRASYTTPNLGFRCAGAAR